MSIRVRFTLWYVGIMFISLMVMGAVSYYEFIAEPHSRAREGEVTKAELADQTSDFGEIARIVFWSGAPALLLASAGGWWLARKSLAPVTTLTKAVEKIHDRNLREQLPHSGNGDELDRLTEVFNAMTARLDHSFQRIREFTLHASHELKTPLTVMRGELETALREEKLTPAQKERLLSQMDEIGRLAKIVDGLSLLTKADSGQVQLEREPVRLDDLVRENFADAKILAQPHGIQVSLSVCEEITVRGDRHRLRQLLLNLTDNAVKYNQPDGTVSMSLRRIGNAAELKIENTGAGVAPELQPRVFERFFRGDASHGKDVEGCGLGLSIAQWIANAHGGSIQFISEPNKSTTVTLRFPQNQN